MKKVAIVTTHPIQYNAPWFALLAAAGKCQVKVYYTWSQTNSGAKYDPGFGKSIEWDIPLLEGYEYEFVENTSRQPGTHHFNGVVNPTLNARIEEWKPDAVLVIGWSFQSHLSCMRYFHKKVPIFFRGDSTLLNEQPGLKKILRRLFLNWVYRHIDIALYVGENNRQYYLKHGVRQNKLVFAPHAIDNGRFGELTTEGQSTLLNWKKELGIGATDMIVLFAGKLEPVKNPQFILELAKKVNADHIRFLFVGNGTLEKELKEAASGNRQILFLDFQNQQLMPVVYRLGDLIILPSVSETWGLAINEAMAAGKPVMVSDKVGCVVDLVHEKLNGIVFRPGEIEKCAAFLENIRQDKTLLEQMGNHSLSLISQYSFERIVDAIHASLNTVGKSKII